MTMTIRSVSTREFIGLSETNTIGYQAQELLSWRGSRERVARMPCGFQTRHEAPWLTCAQVRRMLTRHRLTSLDVIARERGYRPAPLPCVLTGPPWLLRSRNGQATRRHAPLRR